MTNSDLAAGRSATLAATVRTLGERWWILVICVVLGAGAAYVIDSQKTKLYDATATLQVGSPGTNIPGVINPNASSSEDPQIQQGTTLLLVTSTPVAQRVRTSLKVPETADELAGQVSASAQPDTSLIDVTATDADPRRAAQLASAFAQQYRNFRRDRDRQVYAESIRELEAQLALLAPTATRQQDDLNATLGTLKTIEATTSGGVDVVGLASTPSTASSPRTKRDAAIGAILGLAFGAALVFALDLFDRRLKGLGAFETAYEVTATAAVPVVRHTPRSERERLAAMEPFRILRSGLTSIGGDRGASVVLVTSAMPGEGKSTVAIGLARALAMSGQHVALVELDLRRPTFDKQFGFGDHSRGVVHVLIDGVGLDGLLRMEDPGFPTLEVLPAGGTPHRTSELLGGPELPQMLAELRERFDVVVLDTPPLLPVADTRVLLGLPLVDVVLVVARWHLTGRGQAAQARAILDQHRVTRLGLVVNGVPSSDQAYDYGDYDRPPRPEARQADSGATDPVRF